VLKRLKSQARALKRETYALYLAARDPRTPWYARVLAAAVVAYAFSPFDLIPDFIPVIGYLDDLVVVPLGIALALRLIPAGVMNKCRERAAASDGRRVSRAGAAFMVAVWICVAGFGFLVVRDLVSR
jgi:uncharacterized membrane protein YkvA (DUF1232 family)